MRALLIALLCGSAAAAALLALRGGGESHEAQLAPFVPTPARTAEPRETQPASLAPKPAGAAVPASSSHLQPPVPAPPSLGAASPVSSTAAVTLRARSEASPVHSSFALSSDHQTLIHETLLAAADHELLESEPREDAWATESERLIRDELGRHGSAGDFEVIAVDCRRTLCAIQAFSYGENGHRAWVEAVDDLYKESLASVFDSVNTAFPTQGGRSPVLTFLHRKSATPKP
ncbi:hypothetical protein [Ideonella sp.]|uniref:hypothetical protein n=1 Tax=Ideonella sp. TaxID=1929293 RepID=UPI002B47EF46|nr:hypothetical protein [Ideonella sp.]HJV68842.1 hypothetical protein [Ideonella sp.]